MTLLSNPPTIILASSSPRRAQLLTLAGLEFVQLGVDIDESVIPSEKPEAYIQRMVTTKAYKACATLFNSKLTKSDHELEVAQIKTAQNQGSKFKIILTADTIGVLPDGVSVLVKPENKDDAYRMWTQMSGNTHTVWTAVNLIVVNETGDILASKKVLEKTQVTFIELYQEDMDVYWQTGEPLDKAGGYAIQGRGAVWVSKIDGSYTNVVGLPLSQTVAAIKELQAECL